MQQPLGSFIAVGINHWSAPVEVRERFSLSHTEQAELLRKAKAIGIEAALVVSTCNRTEIFSHDVSVEALSELLTEFSRGTQDDFNTYGFETYGVDAVRHLYEVTVGLNAQILGDLQIVKQVKEAYELAQDSDIMSTEFHRLVHSVFRTHKRIRHETDLGGGHASVASAAVRFAGERITNLKDKNVVLVGTGKIGKVTCKNLVGLGVESITLVNRNKERAADLAERFHVKYAPLSKLTDVIKKAGLVIVATGASTPILRAEHIPTDDHKRVFLDLSVPRNIDPAIADLENVDLANMDDLENETDEARTKRKEAVPKAHQIIRAEIQEYNDWLEEQSVVPTIKALTERLEDIRRQEMERMQHHFPNGDMEKVDLLTHRIVNKIASRSIDILKDKHQQKEDISELIQKVFDLNSEGKLD